MSLNWLFDRMDGFAHRLALINAGGALTYKELNDKVHTWANERLLRAISPGDVVLLDADYSSFSIALLLWLIRNKTITAMTSSVYRAHESKRSDISCAQYLIRCHKDGDFDIEKCENTKTHPLLESVKGADTAGLILFSSGTTGEPKASVHRLDRLLGKFEKQRGAFRTIAVPPLDHMSGLDTLFYTLSSGGTLVCALNREPHTICQIIQQEKVELFPASAAFLTLFILSEAYQEYDLSSVKLVAYGSDIMPAVTLARLREVFPKAQFIQKYGTTELGSPITRSRDSTSSWMKFKSEDVEVKIVNGSLYLRSPYAMLGYLNQPSPFDKEGWIDTEDMVEQDGEFIRVLGRRSEIINVGGRKVYPSEVENVIMQMDNVKDVTVCSEPNALLGNIVCARIALFKSEDLKILKERLRSFCQDKLASYAIPARIYIDQSVSNLGLKKQRSHVKTS